MRVTRQPVLKASDEFVGEWRHLEDHSVEGNAFLSPDFILPAVRHLTPKTRVVTLAVRQDEDLVGLGVFEELAPTLRIPVVHYRAYRCEHTYMSGLLVRDGHVANVANALFAWFRARRRVIGAVEFFARSAEGPLAVALQEASVANRCGWVEYEAFERATVSPSLITDELLTQVWSKNQRNKARRYARDLGRMGEVSYRTVFNRDGWDAPTNKFIELESMGWKGEADSAIASARYREAFYREMVDGFARRGKSYFSQLRCGEQVVATSTNFVSGSVGFGFKIGWHSEFADASPGTLHEHEYIRTSATDLAGVRFVDATADPGSFVDKIWPHRRSMTSGAFATGRASALLLRNLRKVADRRASEA
ncbi:MAG: CelD/BcsL family acetyltransferase involved in cellulose biosynthesis [Bradymonadia bacterium]